MTDALFDAAPFGPPPPSFSELAPRNPREFACPVCQAKPGSPCRRPSGHNVFGGDVHAPRRKLAEQSTAVDVAEELAERHAAAAPAPARPPKAAAQHAQYRRGPRFDPVSSSFKGPAPRWDPCPVCTEGDSHAGPGCPACGFAGELCTPTKEAT